MTKTGYGSETEVDDEAATVSLPTDIERRVNRASNKSAVKLQEVGPRMTLQLTKVEEGLCSGGVIFSECGNSEPNSSCKTHEYIPESEEEQDEKAMLTDED